MRIAIALCISVAAAATAFATWDDPTATSSGTTADISCGGIAGTLQIQQDWSHTTTSNSATSEDGQFGASWSGYQYLMTIGSSGSASATVKHTYTWRFNGNGGNKIQVELEADVVASGACSQSNMSDPSWWWDPSPNVSDAQPQVKRYDKNGNWVATYGYPTPADSYEKVDGTSQGLDGMGNPLASGASGSGTQANPATPGATVYAGATANAGGNVSGTFDGTTGTIGYSTGDYVEVTYTVSGNAGSNCDNASVWQWDLLLDSTLTSTSN